MNYNEALDYIHSTYKFGSVLGLDNIKRLLELLGNPQENMNIIHIAGTNGKGSTSSIINKILVEAGLVVGFYSSPYLETFNERIRLGGENISNDDLGEMTGIVKEAVDEMLKEGFDHPTEFEIVTAIAFLYFAEKAVDILVLEVGLGGRLDSTNVSKTSLVSVITPVDVDHTDVLGDDIVEIAKEKAGIIKPSSVCVIHPQSVEVEDVIISKCSELNTKLVIAPVDSVNIIKTDEYGSEFELNDKTYQLSMIGDYQVRNAAVAITVINALRENYDFSISDEVISVALSKVIWAGRFEIIGRRPTVVIDGAHNLHGAKALAQTLIKVFPNRKITAVAGVLADKDTKGILDAVMPLVQEVIATEPNNPRKLAASELAKIIGSYDKKVSVEPSIRSAVEKSLANARPDDVVLYFGSLYMIGDARTILRSIII